MTINLKMISFFLILGLISLSSAVNLDEVLRNQSMEPDHHYIFLFTSHKRLQCFYYELDSFFYLANQYQSRSELHFTHTIDEFYFQAFRLDREDLPIILSIRNGVVYSFIDEGLPDIFIQTNLREEFTLQLPMSHFQRKLLSFQSSDYVRFTRQILGISRGYNPSLVFITPFIWLSITIVLCASFATYLRRNKDQQLTRVHYLSLLGFWVAFKLLLSPITSYDLYFHHQWKLIMYNLPYDQAYERRCFPLDYPPLFALYQAIWGYILAFLTPNDMQPHMLFKESTYFFFLIRFSVIMTDIAFYFSVVLAFRTFYRKPAQNNSPSSFISQSAIYTFTICFFDIGQMAVDNGGGQYNCLLYALVVLSIVFMYKRRILVASFIYTLSILTKHITLIYSFGFISFLLLTYCLTIQAQKSVRINFGNSAKLAGLVLSCGVIVTLPYLHKLKQMFFFLLGGSNWKQSFVPNLKFVISLIQIPLTGEYNHTSMVPAPISLFCLLLCFVGIFYLAYRERNIHGFRFPAYAFLSAMAFINIMDYIHEKHLNYTWIPLMIYSLYSDSKVFDLMLEFKCFNAVVDFNNASGYNSIFIKHPLLLCNLWLVRNSIPLRFKLFVFYYIVEVVYDYRILLYGDYNPYRHYIEAFIGLYIYYRIVKQIIKSPPLKTVLDTPHSD